MRPPGEWRCCGALLLLHVVLAAAAAAKHPIIIASGGSSCTLPVATLEAFQAAVDGDADFLVLTVASTKDGELVVRPKLTLGDSTNVGDLREFNSFRRSIALGGGRKTSGYFASDLTLKQIKTLWATQSFPERDQSVDRKYRVPTLGEVLELVRKANAGGKDVGVFVQMLDPVYHMNAGLSGYTQVLSALLGAGFKEEFQRRVRIQSYDQKVLREVADQMQSLGLEQYRSSLVWMLHCAQTRITEAQLREFSQFGGAVAPEKELLQELVFAEECGRLISPPCWKTGRYCSGRLRTPPNQGATPPETPLLQRARAAGLKVYPHTFRNEGRFMAVNFASDLQAELDYFAGPRGMGVDGLYTDCTRTTSEWLQLMAAESLLASGASGNAATAAAAAASTSASNAAAAVTAAASKAASGVKSAGVKTWAFGIVAGAALLALLLIGLLTLRSHRRRAHQYKAWKEAGLSQALDADLPVSTGAVWGLQKNTWSSQAGSEAEEPAQASRASSIMSKDSGRSAKLKTYSGMLDSYAQSSRR